MEKSGWILSNNEAGDIVIQKDDELGRFKNDDEATKFVVESYGGLLEALKVMVASFEGALEIDENGEDADGFTYDCLTQAKQEMNKAKGI